MQDPVYGGVPVGAVGSPSEGQMIDAINFHTGTRLTQFRFWLLDENKVPKSTYDITPLVTTATITHDTTQPVHRTMTIEMAETVASQNVDSSGYIANPAGIDYLRDIIQVWCLIGVPGTTGFMQYSLGMFRFTEPTANVPGYALVRQATMSDLTSLVQLAKGFLDDSYSPIPTLLPQGLNLIYAIEALIFNDMFGNVANPASGLLPGQIRGAGVPYTWKAAGWPSVTDRDAVISPSFTIDPGQDFLSIVDQLLFYIKCYDLWVDENGMFHVTQWPPQQNYNSEPSTWTYSTKTDSIITAGLQETLTIDGALANVVTVEIYDSVGNCSFATAVNDDPGSPYSISNLGKYLALTITDNGVPQNTDINWAQAYAKQQLLMATWLADTVTFTTAVNPLHQNLDIISLEIYQKYVSSNSVANVPVIVQTLLADLSNDYQYPAVGTSVPDGYPSEPYGINNKFIETAWAIDIVMPQPGSSQLPGGGAGLTTTLDAVNSKTGYSMTHTCNRVTQMVDPTQITLIDQAYLDAINTPITVTIPTGHGPVPV